MPKIRKWLKKRHYQPTFAIKTQAANATPAKADVQFDAIESQQTLVPYDENLLERSRTQWQFGDWASLAALERDTLQHHPDRAKLALLCAAGHQALGNASEARQHTRLALDWGCGKKLVSQVLISGVYNTLGRAAAVCNQENRAIGHFQTSIQLGASGSDVRLLTQARANQQLAQLGLPNTAPISLVADHVKLANLFDATPGWVAQTVQQCLASADIHEAIDTFVASGKLSTRELFLFYIELAQHLADRKDKLTALHFLESAKEHASQVSKSLQSLLINKFIALGNADEAADIAFDLAMRQGDTLHLGEQANAAILTAYGKGRTAVKAKAEHGHDLLLAYLQAHLKDVQAKVAARRVVLIEIGTTRENVPGQGSTRKIAEFCLKHKLHFITVDMDPHNTRMAANMFASLGAPFEAITSKGEDYLRNYTGQFDFIFLDAYDFDHGGHSALRQSRYKKFLGNPIDEAACHQMHLECAQSVMTKLTGQGLVCFDDTWLVDGKWTAKGTLGMPYLLANGFKLLEARNRAALLVRTA
ncbi:MAG: hypothetical protein Q8L87_15915 [Anaerolineales bacterium]|nr:hypothetical protein [Anaerolineales bacterium]